MRLLHNLWLCLQVSLDGQVMGKHPEQLSLINIHVLG
jgi:hypothetical protein